MFTENLPENSGHAKPGAHAAGSRVLRASQPGERKATGRRRRDLSEHEISAQKDRSLGHEGRDIAKSTEVVDRTEVSTESQVSGDPEVRNEDPTIAGADPVAEDREATDAEFDEAYARASKVARIAEVLVMFTAVVCLVMVVLLSLFVVLFTFTSDPQQGSVAGISPVLIDWGPLLLIIPLGLCFFSALRALKAPSTMKGTRTQVLLSSAAFAGLPLVFLVLTPFLLLL